MTDWQQNVVEGLTDAQRQAVTHVDGPLLVLAGPGSGKTRVITHRIAHLISQGIPAWSILALTFTNKAAGEMRHRISTMLPADLPGRRGLTVATFHSFCARLLRRYASEAGLPERFSIYDTKDQREAIKRALAEAGLSGSNWTPASVLGAISGAKNRLQTARDYAASAGDFYTKSIAKAFTAYERILRDADALDFDDLLLRTARLLKENQTLLTELRERFQYVMIDEYQDTNHVQFVIAHTLAAAHKNLCVVGDPDQSIYGWRGADIRNILEFEQHFADATIVALGENFRSTGHIVAVADTLIQHNRRRKHKPLHTGLDDGHKPTVMYCTDEHHEAQLVADAFKRRHDEEGVAWKDMAVLYRINALSRVMEEHFRQAQIPYVIAQGTAFYDRKEIKEALAYLRFIVNPRDEVSLMRIINTPTRGIGKTSLDRIASWAVRRQITLIDALGRVDEVGGLTPRAVNAVRTFMAMVDPWRRDDAEQDNQLLGRTGPDALAELVERVVRESGLEKMYRNSKSEEDFGRVENLEELVSAAADFALPEDSDRNPVSMSVLDWLASYLESVALVSDADTVDPANGAVTLMTLHAAKGLEFDTIAMVGLEQGLLPHSRAFESEHELEEERRLCFVGMTRAERNLMLTSARMRTHRGMRERQMASQFINELPQDRVMVTDLAGDDAHRGHGAFDDGDEFDAFGDDSYGRRYGRRGGARGDARSGQRRSAEVETTFEHAYGREDGAYPIGCRVRHATFGVGKVEAIERQQSGSRATISFQTVGRKTLILEYAKLERM